MKNLSTIAISILISLSLASCGAGMMAPNTGAQTQQPTIDNTTLGGVLAGIGNVISGTLGITTTDIVGTWVYQQPAVLFESDNLLTKAGGQIAAQRLESKLDTYYQKAGIVRGKVTMTFDKNGNFTQTIGNRQQSGTYKVTNGSVNLTYAGGTGQIFGTTQFDGNNLVIVVDMSKLLQFAQTISAASNNSSLQTISSIASGVSGMKAGLKFRK